MPWVPHAHPPHPRVVGKVGYIRKLELSKPPCSLHEGRTAPDAVLVVAPFHSLSIRNRSGDAGRESLDGAREKKNVSSQTEGTMLPVQICTRPR